MRTHLYTCVCLKKYLFYTDGSTLFPSMVVPSSHRSARCFFHFISLGDGHNTWRGFFGFFSAVLYSSVWANPPRLSTDMEVFPKVSACRARGHASICLTGKWVCQWDKLLEAGLLGQEPAICHSVTLRRHLWSCSLKEIVSAPVQVIPPIHRLCLL